jgi:branched-chain amino acid transport system substrate-binding protein
MKKLFVCLAVATMAAAAPAAAEDGVKIGFVATFSGPAAVIGNDMRDGFNLGLEHLGHKMGGPAVEVLYEDDTQNRTLGNRRPTN